MSDRFRDYINDEVENGDVPQRVTNRMLFAGLKRIDTKLDAQEKRVGLLERWQSKADGAVKAALALAGTGVVITILKIAGVF